MSSSGLLLVLVSLFLGGEDDATPPAPGNPAVTRLRERARGLRPDVEHALGAELGEPVEIVVSAETSGKVFRAELAERLSAIRNGPRGDSLARICEEAFLNPAGFVDRDGRIHAVWKIWGKPDPTAIDLLLTHALVLVHQVRHRDATAFVGTPTTLSELLAREAVLEGHAHYVTRQVAKRRGWEKTLSTMWRGFSSRFTDDPAVYNDFRRSEALDTFAREGGERFIAATIARLGAKQAMRLVFAEPPTLAQVERPATYPGPSRGSGGTEARAHRLRRWLEAECGKGTCRPWPLPAVGIWLEPAGDEASAALEGVREAFLVRDDWNIVDHWMPLWPEPSVLVRLVRTENEKAARAVVAARVAATRVVDGWRRTSRLAPLGAVSYEAGPPWCARRSYGNSEHYLHENQLLWQDGPLVVEMSMIQAADETDGVHRFARRARAVMGLEDAEWVARWRAARNGATGPEALQDPNADVRLEAVRALAGKLDEATLAKLVHDPDWEVRWEALRVLAHDERFAAKRWKGAIRAALRDPEPAVVASACRDLMESPERCEEVEWEEIVGALEHHGATARRAALRLVGEQYLYEVLPLRPALRPRLDDDDIAVRAIAASLLHGAEEGPWMRRAIAKALGDPQPAVRAAALRNLTIRSVWALPEALPALVALLPDPRIGDEAANALGSCGAAAEDAAPALRAALAARDEADFRYVAARALFRITGDPAPLLAVARALRARDAGRDRIWAIRAFKVVADEAEGQAAIDAREELRAARKR